MCTKSISRTNVLWHTGMAIYDLGAVPLMQCCSLLDRHEIAIHTAATFAIAKSLRSLLSMPIPLSRVTSHRRQHYVSRTALPLPDARQEVGLEISCTNLRAAPLALAAPRGFGTKQAYLLPAGPSGLSHMPLCIKTPAVGYVQAPPHRKYTARTPRDPREEGWGRPANQPTHECSSSTASSAPLAHRSRWLRWLRCFLSIFILSIETRHSS